MPERPPEGKAAPALDISNRQHLVQIFFFAAFLLLLWQMLLIVSPFFVAILGSTILAMLVYPMHAWMHKRLKRFPSLAAAISTLFVVLLMVFPTLLFGWAFMKEAAKVYPVVQEWFHQTTFFPNNPEAVRLPSQLKSLWEKAGGFLAFWNIDIQDILLKNLDELSRQTTILATHLLKNTLFVVFNLVILSFTLFFFLRDGPVLILRAVELIPMAASHKQAVLERLKITLYAVIRGVLLIAMLQGVLAGLGFALFGVPFPVLLGALTTLLAPIPVVGHLFVWLSVALCLFASGAHHQALYVFLWNALFVGVIDNLLRPILIGAKAKIPILLMFFGMLGGLRVYGFIGVLSGPLIIALALAFVDIYRREYPWFQSGQK